MRNTITKAESRTHGNANPDSGHLLLATIQGDGTAANLLKLRGLTEERIRTRLNSLDKEPTTLVQEIVHKAHQIAAPFGVSEPSPLHLLAAMTSFTESRAVKALEKFGLTPTNIRTQALRCLTGVTEERGNIAGRQASLSIDCSESIQPLEQLQNLSPRKSINREINPSSSVSTPSSQAARREAPIQSTEIRTNTLLKAGADLERKQKATRAKRAMPDSIPVALEVELGEPLASNTANTSVPLETQSETQLETTLDFGFQLPVNEFPLVATLGRNLTADAAAGQLDKVIGRTKEMERIADVLNKRRGNCPCLIGPSGVGKTAIVEGLAIRLSTGEAKGLGNRIVIEVRPTDLLVGTSVRGALSERLTQLREEVAAAKGQVILFFDEFHTLLSSNDGADAVQELKTSLGRGELPCIAATTNEEYARQIESDPALARRFTSIEVAEPSTDEAMEILRGIEQAYSEHHGVEFAPEALEAAVRLSARYINERVLPDKAIALLDLAGARAQRAEKDFVNGDDVAHVLAEQIGIPANRLAASDKDRLLKLEDHLANRIIGHSHVLSALGETLRRNAAGFRSGRPIGSFLFLGPTGVGKTETAKALDEFLFAGSNTMIRLDMSEFAEAHAVARLVGAPPGYIGHEEGGQLTEAVRRRPYSVVLLDEIEKANPEVLQVLLQVLDDGRLTDGLGRTVVFENTVIVMTSNLGSNLKTRRRNVGFGSARDIEEIPDFTDTIIAAARNALLPELWNRIDEPLVFAPLERSEIAEIASLMLKQVKKQLLSEQDIQLILGEGVVDTLVANGGFDSDFGARPMRRTIQRLVEGPVAKMVLNNDVLPGEAVEATGNGKTLKIKPVSERSSPPLDVDSSVIE
jgi:ATP-dependent Clp protease ATP-binding subunit ClpC